LVQGYPPGSIHGSFEFEVSLPSNTKSKLDFIIIDGETGRRVGLEFTSSTSPRDEAKHATRTYPSELKLDQCAIVNFKQFTEDTGTYFTDGENKEKEVCQVPQYYVLHDKEFQDVVLLYQAHPKDKSAKAIVILPG